MLPRRHRAGAVGLALAVALAIGQAPGGAASPGVPAPFHGAPLVGRTHLRLLVAADPPAVIDVDTGRSTPVTGLALHGSPVIAVQPAGRDALIWVDQATPGRRLPQAQLFLLRHGSTRARRIGSGWEVAASAHGRTLWVEAYRAPERCVLRELTFTGAVRGSRPLPCSTSVADIGSGAVLVTPGAVVDPASDRTLIDASGVLAIAGPYALTTSECCRPLAVITESTGQSRDLAWPSELQGTDQVLVQPGGASIALGFGDPSYQGTGTQVTDVWLVDPATASVQHAPGMPAVVDLKFTSMAWTGDGRLVWLARSYGRRMVGVWRPGEPQILVRSVRFPGRPSGSDSFVPLG
jgi:hypothetical protein